MAASSSANSMSDLMPDFPKGPLTDYREQGTFDWRKLKLAIDGEDVIKFKNDIWSVFKDEKIFSPSPVTLSLEEQRRLAHLQMNVLESKKLMTEDKIFANPRIVAAWMEATFVHNISFVVKHSLVYRMFPQVIRGMGTERHDKYIEACANRDISGCFALTEIAHGSNAKGMLTTATYDVKTKEYILHSGSFEAAKCWVGALGKTATHAVLYAKLITPDGTDHGLHTFIVPVRSTETLMPFPGVIVGDLGEKIALNGVDNGFIMFNSYRIPAENLLNKLGDVDEQGNYVSRIKDPSKRFGASLGILSGGRVQICGMGAIQLQKTISVALRYSAVRKQFGPEDSNEEFPVIEYQQQQIRLMPYLAAAYASRIFSNWISEAHVVLVINSFMGKSDESDTQGLEMHALSSVAKPVITWLARDGIQVCRETCGGHGYLKAARIGDVRNENDASCTYEGENGILIQQTSNWLLAVWKSLQSGDKISSPFNTASFLNDYKNIPSKHNTSKIITDPESLLNAYRRLICYSLELTSDKVQKLAKEGKCNFTIRNNTQAYHAATLSILYAEHAILNNFVNFANDVEDNNCKEVLLKLASLFGAWSLEKHLGTLYMSGYFSGNTGQILRNAIIELCSDIKPEAISLVDVLAPPDHVLDSVLGMSDGNVYQHLQTSIFSNPETFTRPSWWKEVIRTKHQINSKL